MSKTPHPTEVGPARPVSDRHQQAVQTLAALRRLGLHWCLTCSVAGLLFLGGLAWLLVHLGLPRLGIAVPSWADQVASGIVVSALVGLVVLSLVPHKKL
jgi:hypothetical protein